MKENNHYALCPCYISLSITALSRTQQQSCYLWLCNVLLRFEDGSQNLDARWKFQGSFVSFFLVLPLLCSPFLQTVKFSFPQYTLNSLSAILHFSGSGYWPNVKSLCQFEACCMLIPDARKQGRGVEGRSFSSSLFIFGELALCFLSIVFSLK